MKWTVEAGAFEVQIVAWSEDIRLKGTCAISR
jgi:hypothetical protein